MDYAVSVRGWAYVLLPLSYFHCLTFLSVIPEPRIRHSRGVTVALYYPVSDELPW